MTSTEEDEDDEEEVLEDDNVRRAVTAITARAMRQRTYIASARRCQPHLPPDGDPKEEDGDDDGDGYGKKTHLLSMALSASE